MGRKRIQLLHRIPACPEGDGPLQQEDGGCTDCQHDAVPFRPADVAEGCREHDAEQGHDDAVRHGKHIHYRTAFFLSKI